MNVKQQTLRGRSLKGKSLLGEDFSRADIRGTNFVGANLTGANFSQVRTGLRPEWSIGLTMGLFLLTAIPSFIAAYAGAFAATSFPLIETVTGKGIASTLAAILFIVFIGIVLWWGLNNELWGFAIVLMLVITSILAFPGFNETQLVSLLFGFALALEIAGVVTGAIAVAAARILAAKWMVVLIIPIISVIALQGIKSGIEGTTEPSEIMAAVAVAGLFALVLLGLSAYIGWQASIDNPKYALIRQIVVTVCNYGATSFRGADLTDANFTGANLKHADFRDANLTRTRWCGAKHLAQARSSDTYLENPQIRQLLVSLNGQDQNFDHMDLRGLNLQEANLADASLIGTKLSEATLQDADLSRTKLVQAQLYGANLGGACLTGAVIQDWSLSTDTNFEAVKCDYVYMQLPTKADPDPCRKPDNRNEIFQPDDFADFIAPIIKTLNLYQTQNVDPRQIGQQFKTLDLFHHQGLDPTAAAIALKQLATQHPEAELEVVALEGRGDDKVRVQAKVTGRVDRSALSAAYFTKYEEISALPYADLQSLLAGIAEKDERIRSLEKMVTTAIESNKFYVETYYNLGDTVSEKGAININSGGGNISGVVGGDIRDVSGVVNLGTISGTVSNAIGQLPDSPSSNEPGIKDLLQQLQAIIEADTDLPQKGKETALTQVQVLAEVAQNPEQPEKKTMGTQALNLLKGAASFLPDTAKLAEASVKLLPLIGKLLGLPI
jgi:uncharacterized protein YjbI with pentapeptide repeats